MDKIRISATSYLNTLPFVYGIEKSGYLSNYSLSLNVPSGCAVDLISGRADISLVPVAFIPSLQDKFEVFGDYCLGATGRVKTVVLLSNDPLQSIREVYLDGESGTSVKLVKILASEFWQLDNIIWHDIGTDPHKLSDFDFYNDGRALVAIGDKTFRLAKNFAYNFDLAEEWQKFTSMPFVFACWMKSRITDNEMINDFNNALSFGVKHKFEAVREYKSRNLTDIDLEEYVDSHMSYEFDELKKKALTMFLSRLKALKV